MFYLCVITCQCVLYLLPPSWPGVPRKRLKHTQCRYVRQREDAAGTCRPPRQRDSLQVALLRGRPLRHRTGRAGRKRGPTSGWPTQSDGAPEPDVVNTLPTLNDTIQQNKCHCSCSAITVGGGASPSSNTLTARFVFGDAGLGPQRAGHSDHLADQQEVCLHLWEIPVSLWTQTQSVTCLSAFTGLQNADESSISMYLSKMICSVPVNSLDTSSHAVCVLCEQLSTLQTDSEDVKEISHIYSHNAAKTNL